MILSEVNDHVPPIRTGLSAVMCLVTLAWYYSEVVL